MTIQNAQPVHDHKTHLKNAPFSLAFSCALFLVLACCLVRALVHFLFHVFRNFIGVA